MYWNFLIDKLLPFIVDRWPSNYRGGIKIKVQQDNDQTQTKAETLPFFAAVHVTVMGIKLVLQTPKGPGVNVLKMVFLNSI